MIKSAAVLLAAMVAAEYKTNHHFVNLYAAARSPEVKMSESKVRLQMVKRKIQLFPLTRPIGYRAWNCHGNFGKSAKSSVRL